MATPETTAAERVQAYLDVHETRLWGREEVIAWLVDDTHAEHHLTVADLRELLDLRANLVARIQLEIDVQPVDVPVDGHFYYEAVTVGLTDALNIIKQLTA